MVAVLSPDAYCDKLSPREVGHTGAAILIPFQQKGHRIEAHGPDMG